MRKDLGKLNADVEAQTTFANGLLARIAALEEDHNKKTVANQREKALLEADVTQVGAWGRGCEARLSRPDLSRP
jgi:hypothetical protein